MGLRTWMVGVALMSVMAAASGELLCLMPNGVTVTRQLGDCPDDARRVTTGDGVVVRDGPIAKPEAEPPPAPAPAPAAPVVRTPPKAEKTAYDYAMVICRLYRAAGATQCKVHTHWLRESEIEVTIHAAPSQAAADCREVVRAMRAQTGVFGRGEWQIMVYSPFSGDRPIATCDL